MSTFDERRRARAEWPIRRATLGDEPLTDERIPDDPDARLAMLAELTRAEAPRSFALDARDAAGGAARLVSCVT